ncbi:unnamed protein product [Cunninghamella echinulata]
MAGFTVLTEEHSDGTKTTYSVSRWRFYCPIIIFIVGVTIMGLVMGLVVVPGFNRKSDEMGTDNEKKLNDTANENQKKIEEAHIAIEKQSEIDSKRRSCIMGCFYGKCMIQCDMYDNACQDKCREDSRICDRNCELTYPSAS